MGTRSTITFCERINDKIIPYVNIYQQYDGYLEGVGKELCEWLEDKIIVNGFSSDDKRDIANGVGCLVAQYISDKKNGVGNFYIYPIGEGKGYCDYNYTVIIDGIYSYGEKKLKDITTIEVSSWDREPFFKGTIQELLDYIEKAKRGRQMTQSISYDDIIQMMDDYIFELKELMKTNPSLAKEKALKSLLATDMCDEDGNFIGLEKLNE